MASRDQIYSSLRGEWTGTLQYRDFQSNERAVLPAWLEIKPSADGKALDFAYTYDDGPTKTVTENSRIVIDAPAHSFTMASDRDKSVERYQIDANEQRGKRIELTLSGSERENNQPVDVRIVVKIDRNCINSRNKRAPKVSSSNFAMNTRSLGATVSVPGAAGFPATVCGRAGRGC